MPQTITISRDHIAEGLTIRYSDDAGPTSPPSGTPTLTSDNTAVATVHLHHDNLHFDIHPHTDGTANISASIPSGSSTLTSDMLTVTVTDPVPTAMAMDTSTAALIANINIWAASPDFTVSSDGFTATLSTAHNNSTILSSFAHSDGVVQAEFDCPASGAFWVGFAETSQATGGLLGFGSNNIAIRMDGTWWFNNPPGPTPSGLGNLAGRRIGLIYDIDNNKLYAYDAAAPTAVFGAGGAADPVAGTNAFVPAAALSGDIVCAFSSQNNNTGIAITMHSSTAQGNATPPSNVENWITS